MKIMNLIKTCTCIKNHLNLNSIRSYTSALYIPNSLANKEFAVLKPVISIDDDIEQFQKEIDQRGCKFDIKILKEKWNSFQAICSDKQTLKNKQGQYTDKIKKLQALNDSESNESEINELMSLSKLLKQEIKSLNDIISEFETTVIPEILKLPNRVDKRVPQETPVILKTVQDKPSISKTEIQSHIDIGTNLNLIEYKGPYQYYLCNETAYFEIMILLLASNILKDYDFIRVTGPDLIRSVIVEGSGIDHENPLESILIQEEKKDKESRINRLHLIGNASVPSLMTSFTKRQAKEHHFPIKIFTTGRQYMPALKNSESYGLLSVGQATVAQALVSLKDTSTYEEELDKLILATSKIYDKLGSHYRIVIKSIKNMYPSESMRISIEMWSMYLNEYIEVGNISVYGDYLSKRLLFNYKDVSKEVKFPVFISGTLLSVPRVLACLLEENPKEFILPKSIVDEDTLK